MSGPKLKVGLLLNSLEVPAWVAQMLDRIQSEGHAEISLLMIDVSATAADGGSRWRSLLDRPARLPDRFLRFVLTRVIERIGRLRPVRPEAFRTVDLTARLETVPRLQVVPQRTQWSDRLSPSDVHALHSADLDVLVRIGFRILRGDVLTAARAGVWSFHHGDNDVNRGGPPGYWESMTGWDVTGCTLQVLSEDLDNGLVIDKTWASTVHRSLAENNLSNYAKSLSMMPRALARLRRLGQEEFFAQARAARPHPQTYSNPLYRTPRKRDLARILGGRIARGARLVLRKTFWVEQWILVIHPSSSLSLSFWRFTRLVPPRDRYWADPFLLASAGKTWLFYEELMFDTHRAHISVAELTADGRMLEPRKALVENHHLSYPFVFEHEGQFYMVPESRAVRSVPLYRCVEMPHRWEQVATLMDGVAAVDATLHFENGRWWIFVNMVENEGASSSDELFLFHREDLFSGDWAPHPMNPIVSDVRRSRPAGKLFRHNGRLYRPSQDCSRRYGYGLNLNWVETLTPEVYKETPVSKATPDWDADVLGIHTFNRDGGLQVADALIRRSRWS